MKIATEVLVRRADLSEATDAEALLAQLDAYAADPMGNGSRLASEVRGRLIAGLSAVPDALILLAWVGNEAVGTAVCFQGFSTFRARPLLNVHDLCVLPEWRGRGIGRRLLAAIEADAVRRGCCKVTLEVRDDNPGAHALYRREGYGAGESDGRPIQYLFLEKRLSY